MEEIIVISKENLKHTLRSVILDIEEERKSDSVPRVFSINQVAKLLGRSHQTIKKLVLSGILRSTIDGRIPEDAINEYLQR